MPELSCSACRPTVTYIARGWVPIQEAGEGLGVQASESTQRHTCLL
jgi:hypothetical protein